MKSLIETFWFKYSQLQQAVKSGNDHLVSMLDREIEPALIAILEREAADVAEFRMQFQLVIDLLCEDSDDKSCVLHQAINLMMLLDRYFGTEEMVQPVKLKLPIGFRPDKAAVEDSFLNEAILDSLPDRVSVITTDYRYIYSNPLNAEHFGSKPIDLVGHHIVEFIGRERFESTMKRHLDRCFAGEAVEYDYVSSRRGRRVIRCRMTPCKSGRGEIIGAIVVMQQAVGLRQAIPA